LYRENRCIFCSIKSSDFVRQKSNFVSFSTSKSWVILSSIEQRIKEKIEQVGTPLKDWDVRINYGIKTGFNEAFIIDGAKRRQLIAEDPKSDELIRPILRGKDIKRYRHDFADKWVINTHNGIKEKAIKPININDYPAIKHHLDRHYPELVNRADKGDTPYNLRNCAYMDDFSKQKIVWGNLNLDASYAIAPEGFFVSAPCPLITPASMYLLAILNSKLADFYIRVLAKKRNGGYVEYKPMFIERLPVPAIPEKDQKKLTSLVEKRNITKVDNELKSVDATIDNLIYDMYGLTGEEIHFIDFQ